MHMVRSTPMLFFFVQTRSVGLQTNAYGQMRCGACLVMLPLAREGLGEVVCNYECARMLRSQHALVRGEHLAFYGAEKYGEDVASL